MAGDVREVTGDVKGVRGTTSRALQVGDEITAHEQVVTGADGDIVIELRHNRVRWRLGPEQAKTPLEAAAWSAPPPTAAALSGDRTAVAGRHAEREAALTSAGAVDLQPGDTAASEDPPKPTKKKTKKGGGGGGDEPSSPKDDPPAPKGGGAGDCDEVACLLDDTPMPCCNKFKKMSSDNEKPAESNVPETLDRDQIADAIGRSRGALEACGAKYPDAPAVVKVKVRVSTSGSVSSVDAVDETDPAVVGCIAAAIKKTKFPATRKGGTFTFPASIR